MNGSRHQFGIVLGETTDKPSGNAILSTTPLPARDRGGEGKIDAHVISMEKKNEIAYVSRGEAPTASQESGESDSIP
jgi:hypothetical protein